MTRFLVILDHSAVVRFLITGLFDNETEVPIETSVFFSNIVGSSLAEGKLGMRSSHEAPPSPRQLVETHQLIDSRSVVRVGMRSL